MTDPGERDHWQLLASELGTPPPPPGKPANERSEGEGGLQGEQFGVERDTPGAASPEPARPRESRARPAQPPRSVAGWAQLATQLGLSMPAPPQEPSETPSAESAARPIEPSDFVVEGPTIKLLEGPGEFVETPVELVEPSPQADEAEPGAEEEESRARPSGFGAELGEWETGRRRPEHRPHLPGEDRTDRAEQPSELLASEAGQQTTATGPDGGRPEEFGAESPAGVASEEPPERRPKRRRRRRPGRKKDDAEKGAASAEGATGLEPPGADVEDEAGEAAESPAATGDRAQSKQKPARDSRGAKPSHRGVPTWKEAIDLLISANLESRAKRPDRPNSSRGRGGRTRGSRNQRKGS
jgi:hypothetical protein